MYVHVLVNELFKYYREKCEHVLKAMNQVKGSKRLRCILHVCLKGGNILNADSKQLGISQGFKLNSFSKITSTKGNQKGLSFLDYVVDKLLAAAPNMLALHSEFPDLDTCRQISIVAITSEVKALETQLETGNQLIQSEYTDRGETAPEEALKVLNKAQVSVERCKLMLEECIESYCAVCEYIGEEKELSKVEEIAVQLSNVVNTIVNAVQAGFARKQKQMNEKK